MKKYRNISVTINTVVSMLLLLIFAVCMMLIIGSAAGSYSRINKNYETSFTASASIRYISNKIKSAERIEISENRMILQSGRAVNLIYFSNGGLYEKTVVEGSEYDFSGGEKLFGINSVEISEKDDFYKISVTVGGETKAALVRKG